MRIARYIAEAGVASRRKADQMVLEGRVTVNGRPVTEAWLEVDPDKDLVRVDGRQIQLARHIYVLLNKPAGCLSAVSDPRGRITVADLVGRQMPELLNGPGAPGAAGRKGTAGGKCSAGGKEGYSAAEPRLYPVGRLDYDTEGLILLTNDGELANRLMHPRYGVEKTYHATVAGVPGESVLEQLRQGIELDDGWTAPARVRLLAPQETAAGPASPSPGSILEITIHEGRKRQVKRMCAAIGHPVIRLARVGYAFLRPGELQPGQCRLLNSEEIEQLRKISEPNK